MENAQGEGRHATGSMKKSGRGFHCLAEGRIVEDMCLMIAPTPSHLYVYEMSNVGHRYLVEELSGVTSFLYIRQRLLVE